MYWYRLETQLGRYDLVSSTIKEGKQLPEEHLVADEKHTRIKGEKAYIATTCANDISSSCGKKTRSPKSVIKRKFQMKIDHICIAVKSISKASDKFCKAFGYTVYTDIVENTRQQVNVQFLRKEGSLEIKLIEPSSLKSPLISFLRKGEGLHHICFKTENLNSTMKSLEQLGIRVLSEPEPGEAFDNELIAFLYAGHGLNFEVVETYKRKLKKT